MVSVRKGLFGINADSAEEGIWGEGEGADAAEQKFSGEDAD